MKDVAPAGPGGDGAAVALAQALVRINTVNRHSGDPHPGNEGEGQRLLLPLLRELGARTELFDCPADVYDRLGVLGPRDRDFRDRPNLLAELEFGAGGPTVVLQGHMDTVDAHAMTLADPFSGEIREGKLWGRGSSDMKGGLAAAVTALRALYDVRHELTGRVIFASVVEEESNGSGAGALAWIDRARRASSSAGPSVRRGRGPGRSGDLHRRLRPGRLPRGFGGVLTVTVDVAGPRPPAHAGSVSAIEKALVVKGAIDRYRAERRRSARGATSTWASSGSTDPAVVAREASMSLNMVPYADTIAAERAGVGFGTSPGGSASTPSWPRRPAPIPGSPAHRPRIEWIKDLLSFGCPRPPPGGRPRGGPPRDPGAGAGGGRQPGVERRLLSAPASRARGIVYGRARRGRRAAQGSSAICGGSRTARACSAPSSTGACGPDPRALREEAGPGVELPQGLEGQGVDGHERGDQGRQQGGAEPGERQAPQQLAQAGGEQDAQQGEHREQEAPLGLAVGQVVDDDPAEAGQDEPGGEEGRRAGKRRAATATRAPAPPAASRRA